MYRMLGTQDNSQSYDYVDNYGEVKKLQQFSKIQIVWGKQCKSADMLADHIPTQE